MPDKKPVSLTQDPIGSTLIRLASPMALGIVSILAFNLVDTFFIGLLGTQALAAISFTFPVTFMVSSVLMGVGIGVSSVLAHILGQGEIDRAARITSHSLLLGLTLILPMSVIGYLLIYPLFRLMGAPEHLLPLIHAYMALWYIAIPLLAVPMIGNAAIRASGDTRTPAIVMGVAGLINGLLDPLLIFGLGPFPKLGIQGAIIATALSWLMALGVSLFILRCKKQLLTFEWGSWGELVEHWRKVLRIGIPAVITNLMTPLANALLLVILAKFGTEVVAAYGAASRVESLSLILFMALSSVLSTFVAQNTGAGLHQRSRKALLLSIQFTLLCGLVIYAIVYLLSPWIGQIFSKNSAVEQWIITYLRIVPLGYGLQGVLMLLASAFNGLQTPLLSLLSNAIRLFLFYIPFAWLGSLFAGIEGTFLGLLFASVTAGLCALWFALRDFPSRFLKL